MTKIELLELTQLPQLDPKIDEFSNASSGNCLIDNGGGC
jgi:hypothetical protein